MKPGATVATHYLVIETDAEGVERVIYDTTDRNLARHVTTKANKLRQPDRTHPAYDLRVVT